MQPDIVSRSIWASFERLPPDERSLVEFICVYRRFDAQIIDYIAQALRIDIDHDQVTALPMVERYEGDRGRMASVCGLCSDNACWNGCAETTTPRTSARIASQPGTSTRISIH